MKSFPCFKVLSKHYPKNLDRVYGLIWQHCQELGSCSMSVQNLANELALTRSTVNKLIKYLRNRNFILDEHNGIRHIPHTYRIVPETLEKVNGMWERGEFDG